MKLLLFTLALTGISFSAHQIRQPPPPPPPPPLDLNDTRNLPILRDGITLTLASKPWKAVGANVYWLALDENVIPPPGSDFYPPENISYPTNGRVVEVMDIVKAMGGTMIRAHTLGSNTGSPLALMPERGIMNDRAFDFIDFAVYQAREKGLRLMVPLVDNYDYYHGGKFDFLRWSGLDLSQAHDSTNPEIMKFYNDPSIVTLFKSYCTRLLTHKNPLTGLTYAEDPTIFAIESGNELLGPTWGDMNVPTAWVREIAQHIKGIAPDKLFVDGTYGVNATHFEVEEVDIYSNHYYPTSTAKLQGDLDLLKAAGRPYFAGEYDWVGFDGDELVDWYKAIEESDAVIGDTFWSLFGRNVPNCNQWVNHTDGFTMSYGNPENSDYINGRIKLVRKHLTKMSTGEDVAVDEDLPAVPCPVE